MGLLILEWKFITVGVVSSPQNIRHVVNTFLSILVKDVCASRIILSEIYPLWFQACHTTLKINIGQALVSGNSYVREVQSEMGGAGKLSRWGKPKHESKAVLEPLLNFRSLNRKTTYYPVKPEWPSPGHQGIKNAGMASATLTLKALATFSLSRLRSAFHLLSENIWL